MRMSSYQEEVGALDDAVPVHYYPEGVETVSASTSRPLDASNKGFQLLQRLGWRGKGLGRNEHGEQQRAAACRIHAGGSKGGWDSSRWGQCMLGCPLRRPHTALTVACRLLLCTTHPFLHLLLILASAAAVGCSHYCCCCRHH